MCSDQVIQILADVIFDALPASVMDLLITSSDVLRTTSALPDTISEAIGGAPNLPDLLGTRTRYAMHLLQLQGSHWGLDLLQKFVAQACKGDMEQQLRPLDVSFGVNKDTWMAGWYLMIQQGANATSPEELTTKIAEVRL